MNSGRLLALEGLDGCGKSTQVAALAAALRHAGHDIVVTREPTDGAVGRRIRERARAGTRISPEEELDRFVEDRRAHVADVIRPALESRRIVVTDRYYLSSVAYQGARGLDAELILTENEAEFPAPDLAILFEIEPALALERVGARGGAPEPAFEQLEFLERVAVNYRALNRGYIARIDAAGSEEAVHTAVVDCLRARLGLFN